MYCIVQVLQFLVRPFIKLTDLVEMTSPRPYDTTVHLNASRMWGWERLFYNKKDVGSHRMNDNATTRTRHCTATVTLSIVIIMKVDNDDDGGRTPSTRHIPTLLPLFNKNLNQHWCHWWWASGILTVSFQAENWLRRSHGWRLVGCLIRCLVGSTRLVRERDKRH